MKNNILKQWSLPFGAITPKKLSCFPDVKTLPQKNFKWTVLSIFLLFMQTFAQDVTVSIR